MKYGAKFLLCTLVLAFSLVAVGCSSGSASGSAAPASSSSDASSVASSSVSSADGSAGSAVSSSAQAADPDSASTASRQAQVSDLANGTYSVRVTTDSSMFHVNEADKDLGELTVSDDGMVVHIRLASKKITLLYQGTVEQAEADEAGQIQPSNDTVTFDDGSVKEVYGFDLPVPALGEPFDVAILGSKGKWYDHKVTVFPPDTK